eukprot:TRINITY_DN1637_c2_g2_i1.p1 TRINITY_DN1637_c2_g2~~TRINITY_DN1637_c2_g2_i1.p1  ORF type:complete len:387 (-),score=143.06 TRINITY_DN1637_c2_g2_i1:120-1280(-)
MSISQEEKLNIIELIVENVKEWESLKNDKNNLNNIIIEKMNVISANKVIFADCCNDSIVPRRLVLKFPLVNIFSAVFNLEEQKIVNDFVSDFRGKLGLNPRVLYIDKNSRIDEFVECTTLSKNDYFDESIMLNLSEALCELHHNVELKKQYSLLRGKYTLKHRLIDMHKIYKMNFPIRKSVTNEQVDIAYQSFAFESNRLMERLLDDQFFTNLLNHLTQDLENEENIVFSHNDLSVTNVLKLKKDNSLMIIDFDGSNLCFKGYDIGYTFNSLEYDIVKGIAIENQLNNEQKLKFIRNYLTFYYNHFYLQSSQFTQNQLDLETYLNIQIPILIEQIKKGQILSRLFIVIMFGATNDWNAFKLIGNEAIKIQILLTQQIITYYEQNCI